MHLSENKKTFLKSFFITLLIIIFAVSFVVADYRCRSTTLGDDTPSFSLSAKAEKTYLDIYSLGIKTSVDITTLSNFWNGFLEFICFPTNAVV